MDNIKITFIGGGNMARALIGGLIGKGLSPENITVSDPTAAQRHAAESDFGVHASADNAEAVSTSRVVVLAVKPQIMGEVLASISSTLAPDCLIISVVAGVTLETLTRGLGEGRPLIRTMPNTPALYGAGISALVAGPSTSDADCALAESVMGAAGQTVWVDDEALMDAVTAVSGSGPAYFFALTEHLAAAGEKAGLPASIAARLARQTAVGAGVMLAKSELEAGQLRARVTSPGGTTEAALQSFSADHFDQVVERAVDAAVRRGRKLGAD